MLVLQSNDGLGDSLPPKLDRRREGKEGERGLHLKFSFTFSFFLFFFRIQVNLGSDLWVGFSLTKRDLQRLNSTLCLWPLASVFGLKSRRSHFSLFRRIWGEVIQDQEHLQWWAILQIKIFIFLSDFLFVSQQISRAERDASDKYFVWIKM